MRRFPGMAVCNEIKGFSRAHERVADFFSLLAVGLLFGSVWAILTYHQPVLGWISEYVLLHTALVIGVVVLDVFLILALLMVGSARFGEDDERCFGTFSGRRNHHSKRGPFSIWIAHLENVGKRHR
jgi:hypothetical protein